MFTKYRCGVCGKEYDTIKERNACEIKCIEKSERAAEELKKKELAAKKQSRADAINAKLTELADLWVQYVKDYGEDPNIKILVKKLDEKMGGTFMTFEKKTPSDKEVDEFVKAWLNFLN